tara:strand:- start:64 stop:354 length:291 start_codon:yes stop_codon:yes gene_type:complete
MITQLIYCCNLFKWFIVGGIRLNKPIKKTQSRKNKVVHTNWSKSEYQSHFRNATSNLGMLHEARELWNEKPLEYRRRKEKQWEVRYGKDWRKHVVI